MALSILLDTELIISQQCALAAKMTNSIRGCIMKNISSRLRKLFLTLCSALGPVMGYQVRGKIWTYWSKCSEGLWKWWDWSICHIRRSSKHWDCLVSRRMGLIWILPTWLEVESIKKRWNHILLSGAQQKDKRQWIQIGKKEILFKQDSSGGRKKTHCPEYLWSLHVYIYQRPRGTGIRAIWYHCALSMGTKPNHFQRSSPTSTSCDSVVSKDRWEFCKTCQFQFTGEKIRRNTKIVSSSHSLPNNNKKTKPEQVWRTLLYLSCLKVPDRQQC